MFDKKKIGNRLGGFAKSRSWSKAELAWMLNISPQSLTDYFNGRTKPGDSLLSRLENLGCDIKWLLFGGEVISNKIIDDGLIRENEHLRISNEALEDKIIELKKQIKLLRRLKGVGGDTERLLYEKEGIEV